MLNLIAVLHGHLLMTFLTWRISVNVFSGGWLFNVHVTEYTFVFAVSEECRAAQSG